MEERRIQELMQKGLKELQVLKVGEICGFKDCGLCWSADLREAAECCPCQACNRGHNGCLVGTKEGR